MFSATLNDYSLLILEQCFKYDKSTTQNVVSVAELLNLGEETISMSGQIVDNLTTAYVALMKVVRIQLSQKPIFIYLTQENITFEKMLQ